MTEATQLAELPPQESALDVYSKPSGLEPWLEKIRAEVSGHVPDMTTKKGRDATASLAFKVRKSKTALDALGKKLVDDLKDVPRRIDAERKRMRDTLDALADEVRAPLTAWEQAEETRVANHKHELAMMQSFADCSDLDAGMIRANIEHVAGVTVDESWEEFEPEAHRVKSRTLESLQQALAAREKHEAEQAELARLRAEAAAREKKDREERIAREAAAEAQRKADERAQAERDAAARREAEAREAAEKAHLAAELADQRRIAAEQQAKLDRAAAAERERLASEQAEKDRAQAAEQAAAAERQRIADEQATEAAEARRREEDKAHKASINRAALDAFVQAGMPEDCAKQAITLIAKGLIPNIRITY